MPAIDKLFDYLVPELFGDQVRVGAMVRIALGGRRVGGWVVEDWVTPPAGVALRPLAKVTGWGPPPEVVELAPWAAWRWAGRAATFLRTASPPTAVRGLPRPGSPVAVDAPPCDLFDRPRAVVRVAPADDAFDIVLAAAARGPALVLAPSVDDAAVVAMRLRRHGVRVALLPGDWAQARAGGCTVVGARAAAWAPFPPSNCEHLSPHSGDRCSQFGFGAAVVLDAHDEVYQEERAPTWNAWQVVAERAARAGAPCVLVSPCPTVEQAEWGEVVTPSRSEERAGWPVLDVVDRRKDDPRSGLFSERLVVALRSGGRVVCVLNRKGRARLLACGACGELARCERCHAAVESSGAVLRCRSCGLERPPVCAACGAQRMKTLRAGVARGGEELAARARVPVAELTGESGDVPEARVVVGTEAALHRVPNADLVAFLDMDAELLAARYRAAEQALALLARAARLVGGRASAGRVLVQTRMPDHEALQSALHADPGILLRAEGERRRALQLPPYAALAVVSGEASAAFAAALAGVEAAPVADDRWLVRAPDHQSLCDALAAVPRPAGRLRVEVDPLRNA